MRTIVAAPKEGFVFFFIAHTHHLTTIHKSYGTVARYYQFSLSAGINTTTTDEFNPYG
ncbi:hypothetical protein RYX36_036507, partial [Vicia faba]